MLGEAIFVSTEVAVQSAAWFIAAVMLLMFVPRDKIREAFVIFFFKQMLTWAVGLIVVQYRLIEYPVRMFSFATKASFTFEFMIYPAICAVFNLHYPEAKNRLGQFMYYFYYCSAITAFEVVLEKYTMVIKYLNWNWSVTWITLFITFYFSRVFYLWFFRRRTDGAWIANPDY